VSRVVFVTLMLMVGPAGAGQAVPGQSYAGTWVADLKGTTYARLELEPADGTLRGRLALGNMQVDGQGQVIKAEAAPRELTPIFDVTLRITGLSFARKDVNDSDRFQMRLLDNETAELLYIPSEEDRKELAAEGIAVPKPIRLRRLGRTSGSVFGAGVGSR
jgi:hypothetical protein